MDWAWSSADDPKARLAKILYSQRHIGSLDTTLVVKTLGSPHKAITKVTDLLTDLDANATPKPIGDLILISHGLDSGWLGLDLDSAAGTETNFQVLHTILDTTDPTSVHRKTALTIPTSLTGANSRVLLAGCRVGQAPKFVDALKQVLGGKVPVVAPKHFHVFDALVRRYRRSKTTVQLGMYEFLCYGFDAVSKTALNRDALVKALKDNPKNTLLDGSSIPEATWKQWLPTRIPGPTGIVPMPVTVDLGRDIAGHKTQSYGEFRHLLPKYHVKLSNPPAALLKEPGLKTYLQGRPSFQDDWGFPEWAQWGNASFDEWFGSWKWKLSGPDRKNNIVWTGTRHHYLALVPITDTTKTPPKLFYNFFPPRTGSTLTPIKELDDTNAKLFYRTP